MDLSTISFTIILYLFSVHLACYALLGGVFLLKRKEQNDRSRLYIGLSALTYAFGCLIFVASDLLYPESKHFSTNMLESYPTMVAFIIWLFAPLYILEVRKPNWLTWPKLLIGISPWILVSATFVIWHASTGFCALTPIHSIADILDNLNTEIILRLLMVAIILPYAIAIFCIRSNWRRTSAPQPWVRIITIGILLCTFTFVGGMVLRYQWCILLHFLVLDTVLIVATILEYNIRIPVPEQFTPATNDQWDDLPIVTKGMTPLSAAILELMKSGIWQNPDLDRDDISSLLSTNRNYLANAVQELGFKNTLDMINHFRVQHLKMLMQQNPNSITSDLIFQAGYRNRDTANRYFLQHYGMSISAYQKSLNSVVLG